MNQTIKISELPLFDAVDYLKTDIDMAQYLAAVREDGDPALLLAAIKDITKAKKIRGTNKIDGAWDLKSTPLKRKWTAMQSIFIGAALDYLSMAKIDAVMSSTLPVPLILRYAGALTLSAGFACAAQLE